METNTRYRLETDSCFSLESLVGDTLPGSGDDKPVSNSSTPESGRPAFFLEYFAHLESYVVKNREDRIYKATQILAERFSADKEWASLIALAIYYVVNKFGGSNDEP